MIQYKSNNCARFARLARLMKSVSREEITLRETRTSQNTKRMGKSAGEVETLSAEATEVTGASLIAKL